jgi:hypothetical protein
MEAEHKRKANTEKGLSRAQVWSSPEQLQRAAKRRTVAGALPFLPQLQHALSKPSACSSSPAHPHI